jgi:hypothetical protein
MRRCGATFRGVTYIDECDTPMMESALLLQIIVLYFLLRPARDWYVVEHQVGHGLSIPSSLDGAFSEAHLAAHHLAIQETSASQATLVDGQGGKILISQYVFENVDVAKQEFSSFKNLFPYGDEGAHSHRVYLRRIVARSRGQAITLPPRTYGTKDGFILEHYSSLPLLKEVMHS